MLIIPNRIEREQYTSFYCYCSY